MTSTFEAARRRDTGTPASASAGWVATTAVVALVAVAAQLRLVGLEQPGLWLDEILAIFRAQISPFTTSWTWSTDPQHGPLFHTMLWVMDHVHPTDGGYRFPFALLGVLTVPLVYVVGRDLAGTAAGILSAALFASAPLHVYLTREARPYGLLVFLQVLAMACATRQMTGPPSRRWQRLLLAANVVAVLASSQGIWYVLLGLVSYLCVRVSWSRDAWREPVRTVLLNGVVASVLFFAIHGYLLIKSPDAVGTPPITLDFVGRMFNGMVTGIQEHLPLNAEGRRAGLAIVVSAVVLMLLRPRAATACLATGLAGFWLPFALLLVADHGLRTRFVLGGVAPFTLLLGGAAGALLQTVAGLVPAWRARASLVASVAACALCWPVTTYYAPLIREANSYKPDWRRVALLLKEQARPGDLVLTSNDWARVNLLYHLPRVGANLELVSAEESVERATTLLAGRQVAFLVSGGWHATQDILRWQSRFPELLSQRNDTVRVNFYPDRDTLVTARPSMREVARQERALRDQSNGALVPGLNAGDLLTQGWGDPERDGRGEFRWVLGRTAAFVVPVSTAPPKILHLRAFPFGPIGQAQWLRVTVNGKEAWSGSLADTPDLDISVPAGAWSTGGNLVRLEFTDAKRPRDVLPGSRDDRELAAMVRELRVEW